MSEHTCKAHQQKFALRGLGRKVFILSALLLVAHGHYARSVEPDCEPYLSNKPKELKWLPSEFGRGVSFPGKHGGRVLRFEIDKKAKDALRSRHLFEDKEHRFDFILREWRNKKVSDELLELMGVRLQETDTAYQFEIADSVEWEGLIRKLGSNIHVIPGDGYIDEYVIETHLEQGAYVPQSNASGYLFHDAMGHRLGYLSITPEFWGVIQALAKRNNEIANHPSVRDVISKLSAFRSENSPYHRLYSRLASSLGSAGQLVEVMTDHFNPFEEIESGGYDNTLEIRKNDTILNTKSPRLAEISPLPPGLSRDELVAVVELIEGLKTQFLDEHKQDPVFRQFLDKIDQKRVATEAREQLKTYLKNYQACCSQP